MTASVPRGSLWLRIQIASTVGLFLAGCAGSNAESAAFETAYMEGMIDHHSMAVEMGGMCVESATHEELRTMCEGIVSGQTAEIEQFQTWLSDWYGVDHEPQMSEADHQMTQELDALDGEEFEIEFMQMMIEHHQSAITDSQECTSSASHDELIGVCQDIVEAQTAEIAQLETWLCDWYTLCDGGSSH